MLLPLVVLLVVSHTYSLVSSAPTPTPIPTSLSHTPLTCGTSSISTSTFTSSTKEESLLKMEMDSILQKHRRRTAATAPGAEWTKQKRDTVSSSSSSSASTATVPISDDYVLLEEEWPRIEIHVVFHYSYLVVRNSLSSSFFSSANKSISAQLKSLNLDFKDTGFSFTLSTPINFINLNATIPKDQDRRERVAIDPDLPFKQLHRIGGAETLNVYLHTLNASLFGYANYASEYQFHPGDDGIVLNKRTMPKSKDSYWLYGDGKTLTHETGHWLQLRHTFEGNCTFPNDLLEDTPPQKFPSFSCSHVYFSFLSSPPINRCLLDDFEKVGLDRAEFILTRKDVDPRFEHQLNYMDYGPDLICGRRFFTEMQIARMHAAWNTFRRSFLIEL